MPPSSVSAAASSAGGDTVLEEPGALPEARRGLHPWAEADFNTKQLPCSVLTNLLKKGHC